MQRKLRNLVRLGWSDAHCEPPKLWPGDRRQIARRAFNASGFPRGSDPVAIAKVLGFRVRCVPVRGCGGEITDGLHIIFRWHSDPLERRFRVAHGLAHALLMREAWDHTETDALLLTLDFA